MEKMIFNYTKNTVALSADPITGLSSYYIEKSEKCTTDVNVYAFGLVDAFGSTALTWIPKTISCDVIITSPAGPGYTNGYITETLSGWHSTSNRNLVPKISVTSDDVHEDSDEI